MSNHDAVFDTKPLLVVDMVRKIREKRKLTPQHRAIPNDDVMIELMYAGDNQLTEQLFGYDDGQIDINMDTVPTRVKGKHCAEFIPASIYMEYKNSPKHRLNEVTSLHQLVSE